MIKIAGSGPGSGSFSHRHGYADPNPDPVTPKCHGSATLVKTLEIIYVSTVHFLPSFIETLAMCSR
jgi:hypothetical protein